MPPRAAYPANWTVRRARDEYFAQNGLSEAGYTARWVHLPVGPITLRFPNTKQRRQAVVLHDLHHIATEYDTTWTGEAEIAAWELAAGCGPYPAAWFLNASAALIGLAIAPRRTTRAFRRGRQSRALYRDTRPGVFPTHLLDQTVSDLRHHLGLPPT